MRWVGSVALAAVLLAHVEPTGLPVQSQEPFFPASVRYPPASRNPDSAGASDVSAWNRDLSAIKAAGFNSVTTEVAWADSEVAAGRYRLERLDGLLEAAGHAGLRVIVQVDTTMAPAWLQRKY